MTRQSNKQFINNFLPNRQQRIETLLNKHLTALPGPQNLCTAIRYAVLNGGKRLRPLLVYATGEAYGASLTTLDIPACAIEILHSFSLVHDDLPAIDNDDLRRGKLTCHKAFDEATAILVGDALSILAFQLLNETTTLDPCQIVNMNKILAAGAYNMIGGQDIDQQASKQKLNVTELEKMYLFKTGALIQTAVKLGAIAAKVTDTMELKNLDQFAQNIGLAFQIQDDILNIEGSVEKFGKNIGTDNVNNKITYPMAVGIETARSRIQELYLTAEKKLQQVKGNINYLQELVNPLKSRDF